MSDKLASINRLIEVQGTNGNWDYDPYMHGLYNGLILAKSTMDNTNDPIFRNAPDKWIGIDKNEKLRNSYPALRNAYEEYCIIKKLIEEI